MQKSQCKYGSQPLTQGSPEAINASITLFFHDFKVMTSYFSQNFTIPNFLKYSAQFQFSKLAPKNMKNWLCKSKCGRQSGKSLGKPVIC